MILSHESLNIVILCLNLPEQSKITTHDQNILLEVAHCISMVEHRNHILWQLVWEAKEAGFVTTHSQYQPTEIVM
jgi:hypothetical protein